MKPDQLFIMRRRPLATLGFTFIEMVVVLVLIGIVGVYATPKMLGNPAATLDVQVRTFAADLRRAQLLATVRSTSLCVLTTVNSYSLVSQCAQPSSTITDPANGQAFVGAFIHGVVFSNAPLTPPLQFNSLGQPNQAASYVISSSNGAASFHVNVTALTGYVSITP